MPRTPSLTTAAKAQVGGLLAGALGIGIQIATGVDSFPLIPPGAVLMVAGALVVALVPWRWSPVVGLLVAVWIGVGGVLTFETDSGPRLADPAAVGPFVGIVVGLAGIVVAIVAGVVATVHAVRTPHEAGARS